jgi:uncharacterized protein
LNSKTCLKALNDSGCPQNVIEHSIAVSKKAEKMAVNYSEITGNKLDMEQIECGALLHDIGRSKTHSIDHAVVGAQILRNLKFPDNIVNITIKHIGAGIPLSEAEKLGLEPGDYVPYTIEEKIVAHADNLTNGTNEVEIDSVIKEWEKNFGKDHPSLSRLKKLHNELFQENP